MCYYVLQAPPLTPLSRDVFMCTRFFNTNTSTQQLLKEIRDSFRLQVEQFKQWFEQPQPHLHLNS